MFYTNRTFMLNAGVTLLFLQFIANAIFFVSTGAVRCDNSPDIDGECEETPLLQVQVRNVPAGNDAVAAAQQPPHWKPDLDVARMFAALAKMTYCSGEAGTAGSLEKSCRSGEGYCGRAGLGIQRDSVRTMRLADGDSPNALVAFVARFEATSHRPNLEPGCVIAFRGTWEGTNNRERNMMNNLVPSDFGDCRDECMVHEGFQGVFKLFLPAVLNDLSAIRCTKHEPLYLTGHSMGGAVATIGIFAMKTMGWNVRPSYVFNNPKAGGAGFVRQLSKLFPDDPVAVARMTHAKDNIPSLPSTEKGYNFTWPEVHFRHDESSYKFQVCWGKTDCGMLKYKKLCKMRDCSDHIRNPLAPDDNIAVFRSFTASCYFGQGVAPLTRKQIEVQELPSDDQLKAAKSQMWNTTEPCVDGWQIVPNCVSEFEYRSKVRKGCRPMQSYAPQLGGWMSFIPQQGAWCSLDKVYHNRWATCTECTSLGRAKTPASEQHARGNSEQSVKHSWR